MSIVSLYIDDPRHACGERTFVVVREGRKYAYLLDPWTLERLTLTRETLKRARPSAIEPRRLVKTIKRKRAQWQRFEFRFPATFVKEAIATLQGLARPRRAAPPQFPRTWAAPARMGDSMPTRRGERR